MAGFAITAPAQNRVQRMRPVQPHVGARPATLPPSDPPARDPGESYDTRMSAVIRMTCSSATGGPVALLRLEVGLLHLKWVVGHLRTM